MIGGGNNQSYEDVEQIRVQAEENGHRLAVGATDGSNPPGVFSTNALRWHPTAEGLEKALEWGESLYSRWMNCKEWVIQAMEPADTDSLKE